MKPIVAIALLVLASQAISCGKKSPAPAQDQSASASSHVDVAASPYAFMPRRPIAEPGTSQPPQPPDTRSPDDLAQAACRGADGAWRCPKLAQRRILAATGGQPIIPASWTVPNWYIDPSNSSGCASDSNSGTSSTCGANGTGPLKTWGELQVHRWGCLGAPLACPRLQQNTVITFLSSQSDCSDVVYFAPATEGGAYVALAGGAPTTVASGVSITINAAKNRAAGSNSPLNVTYSSSAAQGQLVQNTTHSSRAWLYHNVSGNEYTTTQPFTPETIGGSATPNEVDTWATNDVVNLLSPVQVCVVAFVPVRGNYTAPYTNTGYLYQMTVLAPSGNGTDDLVLGSNVYVFEVNSQRLILSQGSPNVGAAPSYFTNVAFSGGFRWVGSMAMVGGATMPSSVIMQGTDGGAVSTIAADAIVGGVIGPTLHGNWSFANVYLDQTVTIQNGGISVQAFSSYPGSVIYGSSGNTLQADHSYIRYHGGAGQAVLNFTAPTIVNTGFNFEFDYSHVGCLGVPTAASAYGTCNIAVTPANLDTNLGTTVGCIGVPNGGSVCNEL